MYLGAQLYVFEKEELLAKPDYIFRRLAEIGYQAIEMPFQMDLRRYTAEYNLNYSALHLGCDALHDLPAILPHLHLNNCHNLCISGPLTWHDRSLTNFQKTAEFLNKKARKLQAEGITLHYHNHDFEFIKKETVYPIDILLQQLDLSLIQLCVDSGWIDLAGVDPVRFLQENKQIISYLHLRDYLNGKSVALGQGSVDLKAIVDQAQINLPVQSLVVEHDPSRYALEKLAVSYAYLNGI
ncbi:sugar phosphate isomerase/epimerase family protein [Psychromonas sp.]|uniref:sugar phosphate isomerase/epimerase family protein n=1 Tax=Psychromonas sp. TaxID=1884585 RepID=UPI0039E2AD1F